MSLDDILSIIRIALWFAVATYAVIKGEEFLWAVAFMFICVSAFTLDVFDQPVTLQDFVRTLATVAITVFLFNLLRRKK